MWNTERTKSFWTLWKASIFWYFLFGRVSHPKVANNGNVLRSEIIGSVKMRSYLSGMPELRLGLNDRVQFENSGKRKPVLFDCWQLKKIQMPKEKLLKWKTSLSINVSNWTNSKLTEIFLLFHLMVNSNWCLTVWTQAYAVLAFPTKWLGETSYLDRSNCWIPQK